MIPVNVIGSGSDGNAVILNGNVMIDCGMSYKAISPHLDGVKLILLTHIHGDHFKASTVKRIAFEKPLIRWAGGSWMVKPLVDAGVPKVRIDVINPGFVYNYGIVSVEAFHLTHDVPNVGYKLLFRINGNAERALYATDMDNLNGVVAKGYDLYLVEANYGEEEIRKRIDDHKVNGEFAYERRVIRTHMSQEQCDDFIARSAGPNSRFVYMHQHQERNGDSCLEG